MYKIKHIQSLYILFQVLHFYILAGGNEVHYKKKKNLEKKVQKTMRCAQKAYKQIYYNAIKIIAWLNWWV